ncbi:hypothetical protein A3A36_01860 [Candidatus Kaiserbacteria bacterium RIFCSPLOWO2_01_FULL_52_12b]|uniref:Thioredoxin domain-containing protein n=1 Tax=Candidatus Kaiserbacteria bacterium RIFCSPLOWO2_01_FULL_52_12b TaxID=1798509 RepID=A0A1F6EYA7_9BACT|nr:MAG: hypothetical protein A3A36_01860 [Candidatus Kaiserbacteria bacterium RIFCSPLOWO2_01_FULL_52_12b]
MSLVTRNALIALGITIALVGTVAFAINYLDQARIAELSTIEDQISIDALSLETQFSLLEAVPCDSIASSTTLSGELLTDLDNRLSYAENRLGSDDLQVIRLKKKYSLLEIRDYLITRRLALACGTKPVTVLYFYSNAGDCGDCDKAGYALSYLRDTYPTLRVYSFDYNLDLGALKTFIVVTKTQGPLPAFVINGKHFNGFTSLADLENQFPKGALASTTATSTKR